MGAPLPAPAASLRRSLPTASPTPFRSRRRAGSLHILADRPEAQSEAALLLRHLRNRATETAATATFVSEYEDGDFLLLHSAQRSDAVVLEALIGR